MNHLEAVASRLPTDSARFPGVSARRERTSTRANAPVDEKKKEDSTARVENRAKARDDDRYGDIFVDTNKSIEVYNEWMQKTQPAPGPDNLRRPLWLNRPLHPDESVYRLS